jgi:hypothetical protein
MNLLTNSLGPAEGAIITILVFVVLIGCLLYFGYKQERDGKAKLAAQAKKPSGRKNWTLRSGFGERPSEDYNHEDFEKDGGETKVVRPNADDWNADSLSPNQRPGWTAASREVNRLIVICQRQLKTHKYEDLKETSSGALQLCLTKLSSDHFLTGVCLDWLSCAEQAQGNTYNALLHLESAAMILSEWTAYEAHCKNSLLPRIAGCRQTLGFDR